MIRLKKKYIGRKYIGGVILNSNMSQDQLSKLNVELVEEVKSESKEKINKDSAKKD